MDAKARNKALFRARLNAQKKDKRIDSPLVRLVSAHASSHQILLFFLSQCLYVCCLWGLDFYEELKTRGYGVSV